MVEGAGRRSRGGASPPRYAPRPEERPSVLLPLALNSHLPNSEKKTVVEDDIGKTYIVDDKKFPDCFNLALQHRKMKKKK